jgi:protein TonB
MFAPISTETSAKQYVTFAVILCLQLGLLAAFRAQRFLPLYGSTAILHGYHTPRVVSKLYFHPPPPPEPAQVEVPVEAPPTPKPVAPKASPQATPEKPPEGPASSHSQPPAGDESSSSSVGLLMSPAASWVFEEIPNNPLRQHQGYEEALPESTPEPPILHRYFPEAARGKEMVVDLIIDERGVVIGATVRQGIGEGVEEVLMETLRKWTFYPARMNGIAVPSHRRIRLHFPS